jgi:acetyl esterase
LPAILFSHGGGWEGGTPKQFMHHCEYLAKRDMVTIEADYRQEDLRDGLTEAGAVF